MTTVNMAELVDTLESVGDGVYAYLNTQNGEVFMLTEMEFDAAERGDLDDLSDWEKEGAELAQKVLASEVYLDIGDEIDIHEYRLMEDFCDSQPDENARRLLLAVIKGKGAFRRFKDNAAELGVIDQWYDYRRAYFRERAIEWCNDRGLDWA